MIKDAFIIKNLNYVILSHQIPIYRNFLMVFMILLQPVYLFAFVTEFNTVDGLTYSNYRNSTPFSPFNDAKQFLTSPTFGSPFFSKSNNKNLQNSLYIASTDLKQSYCTGESSAIKLTTNGVFNNGNRFNIEISDKNGSFNSPTLVGTLLSFESGTVNFTFKIPTNIPIGSGYRIRAVATNPSTISPDNGFNIQVTSVPSPVVADDSVAICSGQSVQLSATCSQGNVKWYDSPNDGNTISTNPISPTITADYFAACEGVGTECVSPRTKKHVTVNSINVIVPAIASSCLNSNVDLSTIDINDDVSLKYAWTGPGGFSSTLQNPTITNLVASKEGDYSVTITNAYSCVLSATTSVRIGTKLQTLNVLGNVSVCFNGIISLSVLTSLETGMSYSWTGPNSFTSTEANISRSAFTTVNNTTTYNNGIYTVEASNTAGCTGTASVAISVGNPPNILPAPLSATGSTCEGVSYNIEWAIRGANFRSYSWSGPNGFTASDTAVCDLNLNCNPAIATISNFLPENEGIYTINANFLDELNNSCSISASQNVTLKPKPDIVISSNGTSCVGDLLRFFTTYTPANVGIRSFTWTGPNNFRAAVKDPSFLTNTTAQTGVYRLTAVGENGCTATDSTYAFVVESLPPLVDTSASVVLGNSVTLNAGGCSGKLLWYLSATDELTIMPVSPTFSTFYYAICNNLGCIGGKSKNITLSIKPPIAVSRFSGDWEDKYIWDILRVPLKIDSVIIQPNHVITINSIANANWLTWRGISNLKFASSFSKLNVFGTPTLISEPIIISPPIIVAFQGALTEGNPVVFVASGSGTISWYKNNVILNTNGSTTVYSIDQPARGDVYTARRTVNGILSAASNALTIAAFGGVTPPVIVANPLALIENIPVTFTASGDGVISWYRNGINLNTDGSSLTINQPVLGDVYTARGTVNGILSVASNQLTIVEGVGVTPPVIVADPVALTENIPVTFTASGDGEISWYKNGVNLNTNGSTLTINQPVRGDIYTAKRTVDGIFSVASNALTIVAVQIVIPPVIGANPVALIENIPVTFTAYGEGVISWYKNGVSLNVNGSTYTVDQPARGDIYTAKGSVNDVISEASNALTIVAAEIVMPPVIVANPVTLIENIPVTFTASGSGMFSWYKNGVSLNVNGSTFTVYQPTRGDIYTARASGNATISDASNALTIIAAPNNSEVIITEPVKPAYYFSDGHPASYYDGNLNLPRIFTNEPRYDPVNDMVWLTNDKIKIGINLKRGGQLAWASLINASTNLVYNGYDGGFQVTLDAYQKKDGYTQDGEVSGSGIPGSPIFSYNVTQGGDFLNHAVTLIDYHAVPNGYYVKVRPIHYPLSKKLSETFIEATYTIIGRRVKIDYRYTSFRTDGQWEGGGFDGAGAPACFIVNTLNKYITYKGNSPWTFSDDVTRGTLPIINMGQRIASAEATEYWGMVYDANNPNSGIGAYTAPSATTENNTYFVFKQMEVYAQNRPGTEFNNGFTFFQPFIYFYNIDNRRGNYVKDITCYLMIGNEREIRSEVYKIAGHEDKIPK